MSSRPSRAEMAERCGTLLRADPTRSDRSIARVVGCVHGTVSARRLELERAGEISPRPDRPQLAVQPEWPNLTRAAAGEPGATLKHGVYSPHRLGPLRLEGERWGRERWPWLDDARIALVADLMARVELARRWLEDKGTVVANRSGRVYPVAISLEQWSTRLDALIVRLDAEGRERKSADSETLDSYVASVTAGNGEEAP